jgi:hypothetical protein
MIDRLQDHNLNILLSYNIILLLSMAPFFLMPHLTDAKSLLLPKGISIFVVSLAFGFRIGVGNDIDNYLDMFHAIKIGLDVDVSPGFYLLNLFASHFTYGFNILLALCTFAAYIFIFINCKSSKECMISLWLTFSLGFCFFANDQIKQSIVAATFIGAIKLIEQRRFWTYFAVIVLVSLLFHPSGLVLLLAYFIPGRPVKTIIWFGIFVIVYVLITLNVMQEIYRITLVHVPKYGEIYENYINLFEFEEGSTGIYVMAIPLMALLLHHTTSQDQQNHQGLNIVMLGLAVSVIFKYEPLFARIGSYFVWAFIPVAANNFAYQKFTDKYHKLQAGIFFFLTAIYFQLNLYYNLSQHGMEYSLGFTF